MVCVCVCVCVYVCVLLRVQEFVPFVATSLANPLLHLRLQRKAAQHVPALLHQPSQQLVGEGKGGRLHGPLALHKAQQTPAAPSVRLVALLTRQVGRRRHRWKRVVRVEQQSRGCSAHRRGGFHYRRSGSPTRRSVGLPSGSAQPSEEHITEGGTASALLVHTASLCCRAQATCGAAPRRWRSAPRCAAPAPGWSSCDVEKQRRRRRRSQPRAEEKGDRSVERRGAGTTADWAEALVV